MKGRIVEWWSGGARGAGLLGERTDWQAALKAGNGAGNQAGSELKGFVEALKHRGVIKGRVETHLVGPRDEERLVVEGRIALLLSQNHACTRGDLVITARVGRLAAVRGVLFKLKLHCRRVLQSVYIVPCLAICRSPMKTLHARLSANHQVVIGVHKRV
jgi:hypothetical protein